MKLQEILKKDIKGKDYVYDISVTGIYPIRLSVMYEHEPVWTVTIPENLRIREQLDDTLDDSVQFAIDFLTDDIEQGFVDRFINDCKKKKGQPHKGQKNLKWSFQYEKK